jgi:hypothetical protein
MYSGVSVYHPFHKKKIHAFEVTILNSMCVPHLKIISQICVKCAVKITPMKDTPTLNILISYNKTHKTLRRERHHSYILHGPEIMCNDLALEMTQVLLRQCLCIK